MPLAKALSATATASPPSLQSWAETSSPASISSRTRVLNGQLGVEIDDRRSGDLSVDDRQVLTSVKLRRRVAEHAHDVARRTEPDAAARLRMLEQPEHADHRRGPDGLVPRLVIETYVAADHRRAERLAGRGHAVDHARQLVVDGGVFRRAKIEAVGDRERRRAGAGHVARGLGHRHRAAVERVQVAVPRVAVGAQRDGAVRPLDSHHRRVAARRSDRVRAHHVVVLAVDAPPAGDVGRGQHGKEGPGEIVRLGNFVDVQPLDSVQVGRSFDGELVGRGIDQHRHGQLRHVHRSVGDAHVMAVGHVTDDVAVQAPLGEDGADLVLTPGMRDYQHALLALT